MEVEEQSTQHQSSGDQQVPWQPVLSAPGHLCQMQCRVCNKMTGMAALVLPCGHHFCRRCLALWVGIYVDMYRGQQGEFPCQLCWRLCSLPSGTSLMEYHQDAELEQLSAQLGDMNVQMDQTPTETPGNVTSRPAEDMAKDQTDEVSRDTVGLYDHGNVHVSMGRDSVTALCCSWSHNSRGGHYM